MGTPAITLKQVIELSSEKAKCLSADNQLSYLSGMPVSDTAPAVDWEAAKKFMSISIKFLRCQGGVIETITWSLRKK